MRIVVRLISECSGGVFEGEKEEDEEEEEKKENEEVLWQKQYVKRWGCKNTVFLLSILSCLSMKLHLYCVFTEYVELFELFKIF